MTELIRVGSHPEADYDLDEFKYVTHPNNEERDYFEDMYLIGFQNPSLEVTAKIDHFLKVINKYSSTELENLIPQ